jgi:hypothetical protein
VLATWPTWPTGRGHLADLRACCLAKATRAGPTTKGRRLRTGYEQFLFFGTSCKEFLFFNFLKYNRPTCHWHGEQMFQSLPLTIREVKATEARLNAIYDAAKLGLKGDSLALAAGMLPTEFRQLCVLDPVAEMAEQKGRADGERELSEVMHKAAREGDAKAALEILKHQHGWVAKQAISVEVDQRISITSALAAANERALEFIEAEVLEARPAPARLKAA